jgi:hypothetical protein
MLKFLFAFIALQFATMGGTTPGAAKEGVYTNRCERTLAHHALPILCHLESVPRLCDSDKTGHSIY